MLRRFLISLEYLTDIKFLKGLGDLDRPLDCLMRCNVHTSPDRWMGLVGDELFYQYALSLWLILFQATNDRATQITLSSPPDGAKHGRISYLGDYPEHELAPYPAAAYGRLVEVLQVRGNKVRIEANSQLGTVKLLAPRTLKTFAVREFKLSLTDGTLKLFNLSATPKL